MKQRLLLSALAIFCMADDCDGKPIIKGGDGNIGMVCFGNYTCLEDSICVHWKTQDGKDNSVCAAPQNLVVGGFLIPKVCAECPPPVTCPKQQCPPPITCLPKPSPSPCPECKPCVPGWKRTR